MTGGWRGDHKEFAAVEEFVPVPREEVEVMAGSNLPRPLWVPACDCGNGEAPSLQGGDLYALRPTGPYYTDP